MTQPKVLYFDYNATTPLDHRVLSEMTPYFNEKFGNSVSSHDYGWDAEEAVEIGRKKVAELLHCEHSEIYFTSGATESNNWAIRGLLDSLLLQNRNKKCHIISSPVEHSSLIKVFQFLNKSGLAEVEFAPVNSFGQIEPLMVEKMIRPDTKLMSFMWTNNELGSLNPIEELGQLARKNQIYLHTDATQAIGKVPVHLDRQPIDLLSFSAHKIYGPKGIGVLYIRSRNPHVEIGPLLFGGGHERGRRSGTVNVPGVVGTGKACSLISDLKFPDLKTIEQLRNTLWTKIQKNFPKAVLNGHREQCVPHTLSVRFEGCQVPALIPGVAVSKGSACHSNGSNVSHVLKAIGLNETQAEQTLRISIGRTSSLDEIEELSKRLIEAIKPI